MTPQTPFFRNPCMTFILPLNLFFYIFGTEITRMKPKISLTFNNKVLRSDDSQNSQCHVPALNRFLNLPLIPGLLVLKCVIKPNPPVVLFCVVPEEQQLPAVRSTAFDFGSLFFLARGTILVKWREAAPPQLLHRLDGKHSFFENLAILAEIAEPYGQREVFEVACGSYT